MTTKVTPIQILRSKVLKKRPDPALLLSGQPAVNINATEPGFFFADETGSTLFKVGPCSVGNTAPNAGATGPTGALGNTLGELWMDLTVDILKVWDGTTWLPCRQTSTSGTAIVAPTAPPLTANVDNALWWNSTNGMMYILYNDGTTRQWTQISTNTVP
jgi:hypothetical protein